MKTKDKGKRQGSSVVCGQDTDKRGTWGVENVLERTPIVRIAFLLEKR